MSNLLKRVCSSAAFLGLMLAGVLWNGWSLVALMLLIQVKGLLEFYQLTEALGYQPFKWSGIILSLLFLGLLVLQLPLATFHISLAWILPVLVVAGIICFIRRETEYLPVNLSLTVFGWAYLVLPVLLIILLGFKHGQHQGLLVLFPLTLVWINDTMAYAVGKSLGAKPLVPGLSPGKTWEGTLGGLLFCGLGGLVWYWTDLIALSIIQTTLGGLLIGCGAIVGDLFQSALKRQAGWEDSGAIMPGHGGVLDRFDGMLISMLLVFPLIYTW